MRGCIKIIENNCDPCDNLQNPTLHGLPERGTLTFGVRDVERTEGKEEWNWENSQKMLFRKQNEVEWEMLKGEFCLGTMDQEHPFPNLVSQGIPN